MSRVAWRWRRTAATGTSTSSTRRRSQRPWPGYDWLGGTPGRAAASGRHPEGCRVELGAFPEATWDDVIDVNLKGSFLVSKHVAPRMQALGAGVIVLTASGAGVIGGSSSYAYGSSKGGVHGLPWCCGTTWPRMACECMTSARARCVTPLKVSVIEETLRLTGDVAAYEAEMAASFGPKGSPTSWPGWPPTRQPMSPAPSSLAKHALDGDAAPFCCGRYAPKTRASVRKLSDRMTSVCGP